MKMGFFFYPFIFLLMGVNSEAQIPSKKKTFVRKITVKMNISGDLNEVYQFEGPLGAHLKGDTEKPNSVCENTTFFRQALYRERKSLEVWIELSCMFEGQKKQFKIHRFFVDLKNPEKPNVIAPLSEKLKKISVQLEELEIKGNKSK